MAYGYSRTLTIDRTKVPNTDQVNFPVLFSGTYAYLATVANGGKVTNASGFDIIFTSDSAGLTKLDHEIESYSSTTGAVAFWIRVPTVSTSVDTVIYLWYGNAAITTSQENMTGVWDSNFKGVWHLKDGTTLSAVDSTSSGNHGTITAAVAAAGQINGAASFNGTSARIRLNTTGFSSIAGTVTGWVRANGIPASLALIFMGSRDPTRIYLRQEVTTGNYGITLGSTTVDSGTVLTAATWFYVAVTWSSGTYRLGVNGSLALTGSYAGTAGVGTKASMGSYDDEASTFNSFFAGLIDELRVSNSARAPDWIMTEYNNQSSPSTFYAVGAEVVTPVIILTDTGWLSARGNGPWPFIPQPDKLGYLNNPRWTKTPASAVDHEPCGYWFKC